MPSTFDPYPNESSFLLGKWYWNQGPQKLQEAFTDLLKIIGNVNFLLADVQSTNWGKINNQLAVNDWDENEWVDDAGWK